jgi:Domain of unknown function (DUF4112)
MLNASRAEATAGFPGHASPSCRGLPRHRMSKVSPEPWTIHHDAEFDRREAMARNLERLAWLMDRAFHIPGTRIRVGLDAIIGLLPSAATCSPGWCRPGWCWSRSAITRCPGPSPRACRPTS